MSKFSAVVILASFLFTIQIPAALAQESGGPLISVNSSGTVSAKPDLAILTLTIRSTAPLAVEAASQNERKEKDVESALAASGLAANQYKFTSLAFAPAGGAYSMITQNASTGIEASQFLYVFFEGSDLSDEAKFTAKVAGVIDALGKAGALVGAAPFPYSAIQGGSVVTYTVKDPGQFEKEAVQKATENARAEAKTMAQQLGIPTSNLYRVSASFVRPPRQQPDTRLAGLPYQYYSTDRNSVEITETASVSLSFK